MGIQPAWSLALPWREIRLSCSHFGLDQYLIAAIVQKESGGNPFAMRYEPGYRWLYDVKECAKVMRESIFADTAYTNQTEERLQMFSYGCMQVMGAVAREYGMLDEPLTNLLDPEVGIHYGCKYFHALLERYKGNTAKAIAAYNAGSPRYEGHEEGRRFVNFEYVRDVQKLKELLT